MTIVICILMEKTYKIEHIEILVQKHSKECVMKKTN